MQSHQISTPQNLFTSRQFFLARMYFLTLITLKARKWWRPSEWQQIAPHWESIRTSRRNWKPKLDEIAAHWEIILISSTFAKFWELVGNPQIPMNKVDWIFDLKLKRPEIRSFANVRHKLLKISSKLMMGYNRRVLVEHWTEHRTAFVIVFGKHNFSIRRLTSQNAWPCFIIETKSSRVKARSSKRGSVRGGLGVELLGGGFGERLFYDVCVLHPTQAGTPLNPSAGGKSTRVSGLRGSGSDPHWTGGTE